MTIPLALLKNWSDWQRLNSTDHDEAAWLAIGLRTQDSSAKSRMVALVRVPLNPPDAGVDCLDTLDRCFGAVDRGGGRNKRDHDCRCNRWPLFISESLVIQSLSGLHETLSHLNHCCPGAEISLWQRAASTPKGTWLLLDAGGIPLEPACLEMKAQPKIARKAWAQVRKLLWRASPTSRRFIIVDELGILDLGKKGPD